jgi:outer membrane protein OmpA-like peptidoglycan-associated protein
MKSGHKLVGFLSIISLALASGCATVPKELHDAREAYAHANGSPNAHKAFESLQDAREALIEAEKSYNDHPKSYKTRDLAYVAQRKAQLAEARAAAVEANEHFQKANKVMEASQNEIIHKSNKVPVVEERQRVVITLSGSVLFAIGKSELLPDAHARLNDAVNALLRTKDKVLLIEGHTDSTGSSILNKELSLRRANAVRSYLISHGYPADLIETRGVGPDSPIASNRTPEGRANNRRVEIVVKSN